MSISLKQKLCWCWSSKNANTRFYCSGPQPSNVPEGSRSCQRNPAQHLPKRYLCNSCFSHELRKTLAVQDTLSESWFQQGRLVLRPKSSRSWCFWWWRRCLYSPPLSGHTLNYTGEPGRCWCLQPCTSDYSSCNLLEYSSTLVCEPINSLICLRKQRQNSSCSCAADFDTKKALTKRSTTVIFLCVWKVQASSELFKLGQEVLHNEHQQAKKIRWAKGENADFQQCLQITFREQTWQNSQGKETAQRKME